MPLLLRTVLLGTWRIYAVCDANGNTFLDLLDLNDKEKAKVAATLSRIASDARGPKAIPVERNHLVDSDARLFQLRVDECRILWIFDQGRVVVCCHAYRKKSNKAPPGEIAKGCAVAAMYWEAVERKDIKIISE